MIAVVNHIIFFFWMVWTYLFMLWTLSGQKKNTLLWNILQETKFVFRVVVFAKAVIYDPMLSLPDHAWALPILWVVDLVWLYWIHKDLGDDDRWKRRRKKAAARVQEVAGRLVIVPEPVPISTS